MPSSTSTIVPERLSIRAMRTAIAAIELLRIGSEGPAL